MKDGSGVNQIVMIGGLNLQTYSHIPEVEIYDATTSMWRFYKNLPTEVLNQNRPDAGCIGSVGNTVYFVGSSVVSLDWITWTSEEVTKIPTTSINTKCSGEVVKIILICMQFAKVE